MAHVYAQLDSLAKYQQTILQTITALETQASCKEELIQNTIVKLNGAVSMREQAEYRASAEVTRAEQQLAAAERYTRMYNSNLEEGQSPITTDSYYYDAVYESEQQYSYARAARARAENTLSDFQAYVRRYRQEQQEGLEAYKRLLEKSGKFFESYIKILAAAKKCTAVAADKSGDGIDWENTANTPEEIAIIQGLEGEYGPATVDPNAKDPTPPSKHLPGANKGHFTGAPGNSEFVPSDPSIRKLIGSFGRKSVSYKNEEPDFSPFATHTSQWGKVNTRVTIAHMTGSRTNPKWDMGRRPKGTGHDPNYDLGNYAQADNELLAVMQSQFPGQNITLADVAQFKKDNKLVWHECSDCETMMLVPRAINSYFSHTGGTSESAYRMAWGDVSLPY